MASQVRSVVRTLGWDRYGFPYFFQIICFLGTRTATFLKDHSASGARPGLVLAVTVSVDESAGLRWIEDFSFVCRESVFYNFQWAAR